MSSHNAGQDNSWRVDSDALAEQGEFTPDALDSMRVTGFYETRQYVNDTYVTQLEQLYNDGWCPIDHINFPSTGNNVTTPKGYDNSVNGAETYSKGVWNVLSSNQQKANAAWLKAEDPNSLRMDYSQTGYHYDYLALEDFRQMTEDEKAALADHAREEYEEAISNIDFYEQEWQEHMRQANGG